MAGYGDELMRTGHARGASARGKRIAFGDGQKIMWDKHSAEVFRGNPSIAPPGAEKRPDVEWIEDYKGHRLYMRGGGRGFLFNMEHRAIPGELFFAPSEMEFAKPYSGGFVVIEPNVPAQKHQAVNKQWSVDRFNTVAAELERTGRRVVQFEYPGVRHRIPNVKRVSVPNFRIAMAILSRAALAIVPEGGTHHGAAAVGTKAVVLFGGFIPPAVTGYADHVNLTGGAEACGSLHKCQHCIDAMNAISVDEVLNAANGLLNG